MQDGEQRCKMVGHKSRPNWQFKQPILWDRSLIYNSGFAKETCVINYDE